MIAFRTRDRNGDYTLIRIDIALTPQQSDRYEGDVERFCATVSEIIRTANAWSDASCASEMEALCCAMYEARAMSFNAEDIDDLLVAYTALMDHPDLEDVERAAELAVRAEEAKQRLSEVGDIWKNALDELRLSLCLYAPSWNGADDDLDSDRWDIAYISECNRAVAAGRAIGIDVEVEAYYEGIGIEDILPDR